MPSSKIFSRCYTSSLSNPLFHARHQARENVTPPCHVRLSLYGLSNRFLPSRRACAPFSTAVRNGLRRLFFLVIFFPFLVDPASGTLKLCESPDASLC